MNANDPVAHATCMSMSDILNRIGDKWTVMVVSILVRHGTLRFNELKRQVDGVSQRMLTLTLRNLERDGLVTRNIYPEIPPRVEYSLTELGRSLEGPINALWDWSAENGASMAEARAIYDARNAPEESEPPRLAYAR